MALFATRHAIYRRKTDPVGAYIKSRYGIPYGDPGFFSKLAGFANKLVSGVAPLFPGGEFAVKVADRLIPGGRAGAVRSGSTAATVSHTRRYNPNLPANTPGGPYQGPSGAIPAYMQRGIGPTMPMGGRRRYRRMNPLNYRALKRSTRRIHAAAKIMRTVFHQAKTVRSPKRMPKGLRSYHRKRRAA